MEPWPLAALGNGGERRHALARQPDGGSPLSRQVDLSRASLSLGGPLLSHFPHVACILVDVDSDAIMAGERDRVGRECIFPMRLGLPSC